MLSRVVEKLIFKLLNKHVESKGLLFDGQHAYRSQLGTCNALFDLTCHLQENLYKGFECRVIQIDFSAVFDCYEFQNVGVGVLRLLQDLLTW